MAARYIDFLTNLTQKSTTIDGTEVIHLGSSGLSQKSTTKDLISYGIKDLAQTWNAAGTTFTGLKFNVTDTASGANSLLMDLQVGGVSKFAIDKTGGLKIAASGSLSAMVLNSGSVNGGMFLSSTIPICWAAGTVGAVEADLYLVRDSAGALAVRNSTNAQESRIYATYTSATNYQRTSIKTAKTTLANVAGANVAATNLIPAGAFLFGVTSRINTALGTSNGTTGYSVGTVDDIDLWGSAANTAIGVALGSANYTSTGASGLFIANTNVIVTAQGGNFNGTGVIELAVHYLLTEAD